MKIIILTLLFGLLGYTISKPLENKDDATEALVEERQWQTSALSSWPLQSASLTAYSTYGLNLLTPGLVEHNKDDKLKLAAQQQPLATSLITPASFSPLFQHPQYLSAQPQYFAFNSGFFKAPFHHYAYTANQQYFPHLFTTLPAAVTEKTVLTTTTTPTQAPTTQRPPLIKEREPTTKKPQSLLQVKPPKLQVQPQQQASFTNNIVGDFKTDTALLKAVENINPEYVIEDIINVPGQHVYSSKTMEKHKVSQKLKPKALKQATTQSGKQTQALARKQVPLQDLKPANGQVKVEATGKTSTKGNIPEIPFGTYFLPYFSQDQLQQQKSGKKTAALILEPHSKAIVGNGGTAISTPISRAYLKRGVTTNVYFNPESVAIAGVGGKAHAQADLELDLIN